MADWVLTTGLKTWRGEINEAAPDRDKESDGSVGDYAHAQGTSGHNPEESGHAEYNDGDSKNEVRAIDVDKDLRLALFSMEMLIQWLVTLGRSGVWLPFRYFIFNGRIWRKSTGWVTEKYNGSNPHDHHAHFSGDYSQKADEWTGKLGLVAYVAKVTGKDSFMAFIENRAEFQAEMTAWANSDAGKSALSKVVADYWPADKDGNTRDANLADAVKSAGQRSLNTYDKTVAIEQTVNAIKAAVVPSTTKNKS